MKNRQKLVWLAVLVSGLIVLAHADDIVKTVQAVEYGTQIIYNGKETSPGTKILVHNGNIYLPISSAADLFSKRIEWNEKERSLSIADKSNTELDNLKKELENRDRKIAELQEAIKVLQQEPDQGKMMTIKGLQDKLNSEFKDYIGSSQKILLSGNADEIRVKVVIDLSWDSGAWSKLSSGERAEFLKELCASITSEYNNAKVRGFIKDISNSNRLLNFYNTSGDNVKTGYIRSTNPISILEDKFNDEYDKHLGGICLIYDLTGSENRMDFVANVDMDKYSSKWEKISDYKVKSLMSKIAGEIAAQYKNCEINGSICDMHTGEELASCSKYPKQEFIFSRNN